MNETFYYQFENLWHIGDPEALSTWIHVMDAFNPLPNEKLLDSSKLKEFANNFKFDENNTKLSIQVENFVGKGEIARYEQFSLFPQHFQKICTAGT